MNPVEKQDGRNLTEQEVISLAEQFLTDQYPPELRGNFHLDHVARELYDGNWGIV